MQKWDRILSRLDRLKVAERDVPEGPLTEEWLDELEGDSSEPEWFQSMQMEMEGMTDESDTEPPCEES